MGLTTEKMSGKTLSKPLKWNSHPSPLCQSISKPHSLKTFFQDYIWQSYSLHISKRYEIRLRWKTAGDGSEDSRDLSLLKWLLYSKAPNLNSLSGLKSQTVFPFNLFQNFQVSLFHEKTTMEGFSVKCGEICNMHWFEKSPLVLENHVAEFPNFIQN